MEPEPLPFIDTHCHLHFEQFDADRSEMIERARKGGLQAMVTIGTDLKESHKALALARQEADLHAAVGVHPQDSEGLPSDWLDALRGLAGDPKVVAIGEVGLDYYRQTAPPEVQRRVFISQLSLASELNLPIILHNREAHQDVCEILKDFPSLKGVAHCFSGSVELAHQFIARGWFISFACNITFKNADALRATAKSLPLDHLVIETDAPFLAPQSHRGQRNEPSYIPAAALELAHLHGVAVEEISQKTVENARSLFGIGRGS